MILAQRKASRNNRLRGGRFRQKCTPKFPKRRLAAEQREGHVPPNNPVNSFAGLVYLNGLAGRNQQHQKEPHLSLVPLPGAARHGLELAEGPALFDAGCRGCPKWQCPEIVRKSSGRRTVCGRFPDIEVRKSSAWRTGSGRLPDLGGPRRSPGREIRDFVIGYSPAPMACATTQRAVKRQKSISIQKQRPGLRLCSRGAVAGLFELFHRVGCHRRFASQ